jgi:hypothetical protein
MSLASCEPHSRKTSNQLLACRTAGIGRTRSDVELAEWAAIDWSVSGRSRPSTAVQARTNHRQLPDRNGRSA